MAASDALSGSQFARHAHPLGGPGGIEDKLRSRARWEAEQDAVDPGYRKQLTRNGDHGAAMAMVPNHRPPWWGA